MTTRASNGSDRLWRALSWLLPLSAVVAVGAVGMATRLPGSFSAARLYGGQGCDPLALRAVVVRSSGSTGREEPHRGEVVLRVSGAEGALLELRSTTASDGTVVFNASPGFRPEALSLHSVGSDPAEAAEVLAETRAICREEPRYEPPRDPPVRGGWIEGHPGGVLALRVGIARGVLAVPFAASIVVEVSHAGRSAAGVKLEVRPTGAELIEAPPATDAAGVSRFGLRPKDHVIELAIEARAAAEAGVSLADGELTGSWFGGLPVVPGALFAWRQEAELFVASPIPRERAYVDLVASDRVIGTLNVDLIADGLDVGGSVPLPETVQGVDAATLYAVVSSESDMQSMARVGWPLDEHRVRATRDVHTQLLVDGVAERRQQQSAEARRWRAGIGAWVLICALGEVLVLLRLTRRSGTLAVGAGEIPEQSRGRLWALVCVVLGLLGLASFAWFL